MLGENAHHYHRGLATRYANKYDQLIPAGVTEKVNSSDIVVGNFECTLMQDKTYRGVSLGRAIYAAPESALQCFNNWRPKLVFNVANNHFGQHGKDEMNYTVACLEKRDIKCIGRSSEPLIVNINNYSVSLWGVTLVKDKFKDGGYFKSTAETLIHDIDWGAKTDTSFWVVSIHWGEEYLTLPSSTVKKLASQLIEKGVDLIVGHHPHVVQPVNYIKGLPVAYSHGNFLFEQNFSRLTQTGLMMLTDLIANKIELFLLVNKKYRIDSLEPISAEFLMDYCKKKMSLRTPLLMRVYMKVELLAHAFVVPREVWLFFFSRLFNKFIRRRSD